MDSLHEMQGLLDAVAAHLKDPTKASRRAAAIKLERIVAIASTLAFTIHSTR